MKRGHCNPPNPSDARIRNCQVGTGTYCRLDKGCWHGIPVPTALVKPTIGAGPYLTISDARVSGIRGIAVTPLHDPPAPSRRFLALCRLPAQGLAEQVRQRHDAARRPAWVSF